MTTTKRNKIIYWVATIWLSLGMVATGISQLLRSEQEIASMAKLGYPPYLLTIIGIGKLLGVITVLAPKFPLLKEWAYAGFTFTMLGALVSHMVSNSPAAEFFGPALLLVLTFTSWYFRPADRKVKSIN